MPNPRSIPSTHSSQLDPLTKLKLQLSHPAVTDCSTYLYFQGRTGDPYTVCQDKGDLVLSGHTPNSIMARTDFPALMIASINALL